MGLGGVEGEGCFLSIGSENRGFLVAGPDSSSVSIGTTDAADVVDVVG